MNVPEVENNVVKIDIEDDGDENHAEVGSIASPENPYWKMLVDIAKIVLIVIILELIGKMLGIENVFDRLMAALQMMESIASIADKF